MTQNQSEIRPNNFSALSVFSQFSQRKKAEKSIILLALFGALSIAALPIVGVAFVLGGSLISGVGLLIASAGFGSGAALVGEAAWILRPKGIGWLAQNPKKGFALSAFLLSAFAISMAYAFFPNPIGNLGGLTPLLNTLTTNSMLQFGMQFGVMSIGVGMASTALVLLISRAIPYLSHAYQRRQGRALAAEINPDNPQTVTETESAQLLPQTSLEISGLDQQVISTSDNAFSVFSLNAALFSFGGYENGRDELDYNGKRAPLLGAYLKKLQAQNGNFDCICLQEVSPDNAAMVRDSLKKQEFAHFYFPDDHNASATEGSYDRPAHATAVGSGLFIASRHPIVRSDFRPYENTQGIELLAHKGVQGVAIEKDGVTTRTVYNTHQSASKGGLDKLWKLGDSQDSLGTSQIRDAQTGDVLKFMDDFNEKVKKTHALAGEIVVGDFNRDLGRPGKQSGQTRLQTSRSIKPVLSQRPDETQLAKGQSCLYQDEKGEVRRLHRTSRLGRMRDELAPLSTQRKGDVYLLYDQKKQQVEVQFKDDDNQTHELRIKTEDTEIQKNLHDVTQTLGAKLNPASQSLILTQLAGQETSHQSKSKWETTHNPSLYGVNQSAQEDKKSSTTPTVKIKYPHTQRFFQRFESKSGDSDTTPPTYTTVSKNFVSLRHDEKGGPKGMNYQKLQQEMKKEDAKFKQSGTDTDKQLLRRLRQNPGFNPDKDEAYQHPLQRTNGKKLDIALGRRLPRLDDQKSSADDKSREYEEMIVPTIVKLSQPGRDHTTQDSYMALSDHFGVILNERR